MEYRGCQEYKHGDESVDYFSNPLNISALVESLETVVDRFKIYTVDIAAGTAEKLDVRKEKKRLKEI